MKRTDAKTQWHRYEQEKSKLRQAKLTPQEYERRLKMVAARYGI